MTRIDNMFMLTHLPFKRGLPARESKSPKCCENLGLADVCVFVIAWGQMGSEPGVMEQHQAHRK